MKKMKHLKDSNIEQGWMCPRGDFCEAKPEDAKDIPDLMEVYSAKKKKK